MPRTLVLVALLALIACQPVDLRETDPPMPINLDSCYCANATRSQTTPCPDIPHEVVGTLGTGNFGPGYGGGLSPGIQPYFDVFSWQSFIALNWPADSTGEPLDTMIGDAPRAPRVWELYDDPSVVFGDTTTSDCHARAATDRKKLLTRMSKNSSVDPDGSFQEADGHPLIDRNLNFAVYEIKLNPDESQFVTTHNLTTVSGQSAYADSTEIELPSGYYDNDSLRTGGIVGAIEMKATWRILDTAQGDDPDRYYHRDALVYVDSAHTEDGRPLCIEAIVGLVGLHISHKTQAFTFWVWSTFEHIDNTPEVPSAQQPYDTTHYSFYNPECVYYCEPNAPPALTGIDTVDKRYHWASTPPYAAKYATYDSFTQKYFGSQITRVMPVYGPTKQVDNAFRKKMKGTVWENYRLIGSQWRLLADGPPFPLLDAPNVLANTTLESYIQPTASCVQCHSFASNSYQGKSFKTDFSFVLDIFAQQE